MKAISLILCTLGSLTMLGQNAASNGLQQLLTENWSNGSWQNATRGTYTTDGNGYILHILGEQWNGGSWDTARQTTYTNIEGGNIDNIVGQNGDGTNWTNNNKSIWTYNEDGSVATMTNQMWAGGAWENQSISHYTYNDAGEVTHVLTENWNAGTGAWETYLQQSHTLNEAGEPSEILMQLYNAAGDTWTDYSKQTNTYTNGLLSYYIVEIRIGGNWTNSTEVNRTFDSQGRVTQEIYNLWTGNNWNASSRITYSYGILGLEEFNRPGLSVYPNPASDILHMAGADTLKAVSVYDIQGRAFSLTRDNDAVNVFALPAGIYILNAETEKGISKIKFVKQ